VPQAREPPPHDPHRPRRRDDSHTDHVLLRGDATALTAVKIPLNYVVPFIVSNLGVISGTRTEREADVAATVPKR
jgi:hypothetical protein